jgi:hypothetical protein
VTPADVAAAASKVKEVAKVIPTGATPVGKEAPTEGTDEASRTPAGRWAPGASDAAYLGQYERANERAVERADIRKQIAEGVRGCLYAPELGRIPRKLIDRYVAAFVAITCAAERLKDEAGKVDELAHALEATQILADRGFNAVEFAKLGPIFGRFAQIETEMYDGRRARCPDPREAAAAKAINGPYMGAFAGPRSGVLRLEASDGGLTGTIEFAASKKTAAGQPGSPVSWPIRGSISDRRVHLLATKELAFIRLEAKGSADGYKGRWQGELDFKKLKGTWSMGRPPPPQPPKEAPAQAPSGEVP